MTSSNQQWRLADYLKAGDLRLDADDTRIIDELGGGGPTVVDMEKVRIPGEDAARLPGHVARKEHVTALEYAEAGGATAARRKDGATGLWSRASAVILGLVIIYAMSWRVGWGIPEPSFTL